MLTADLIRPRLQWEGKTLSVKMVDEQDASALRTAQDLLTLLKNMVGQSLAAFQSSLELYEGDRIDYLFIRGLAKILLDAATFTPLSTPLPPKELRARLFAIGPVFSSPADLFHLQTRQEALQQVAGELGIGIDQIDLTFFADRLAAYLLTDLGPSWTPAEVLARYNLELARGVLYWASHMRIDVSDGYKDIWKFLKLFKLMFWAEPLKGGGYRIDLDGPISPFVKSTIRYGRQFAAFLPAVLLCEQWRMIAQVHPPHSPGIMTYQLNETCSLRTHFKKSGEFDSALERNFAQEFEEKFGGQRSHWILKRESTVLLLGDTVMVPDFVLIDKDDENRQIIIELVGFWHETYLKRKVAKVREAHCQNLLLLVYQGLRLTPDAFRETVSEVIFFQQKPVIKDVMGAVEALAERLYGPREKAKRQKAGLSSS
jgi:predicted nuclease of restriction endonuclease-like RecB superfamily